MPAASVDERPTYAAQDTLPNGWVNTAQIAALIGCTYRKLDYWTRAGYLRPVTADTPGSGHQRAYPLAELEVARLMWALVSDGLLPDAAHRVARELLDRGTTTLGGIRLDLPEPL